MTTMLLIAMFLAGPLAGGAAPADAGLLAGNWAGFVNVSPGAMEVDFVVRFAELKADSGKGELVFPTQGKVAHPLTDASAFGDQVMFAIRDEKGIETQFSGRLTKDGSSIEGEAMQGAEKHPFTMHRADRELWTRPEPKPALVELNGSVDKLKNLFNQDAGKVRLVLILSPSCGFCRMTARMTARYLLDVTERQDLSVYTVWEKVTEEDNERTAEEAAGMLVDSRVHQFWSPDRTAGQTFKATIGLTQAVNNVYLAFAGDQDWSAAVPPSPRLFMHNYGEGSKLPQDRMYNGKLFGEEILKLLDKSPDAKVGERPAKAPATRE